MDPTRPRRPNALALAFMLGGLGLVAWFGQQWYELPEYSESDISASVELNLAIDVQRMGPHIRPEGERLEQLRRMVRAEVEGEIRRERETLERWIGAGLVLLVIGFGHTLAAGLRR